MTVTADQLYRRIGAEGVHQPIAIGLTAATRVYRNTVAVVAAATGYLKNADVSLIATDRVMGMIGNPAGGTAIDNGPGILGGTSAGDVIVDCDTGTFYLLNSSAGDLITEADAGKVCYLVDSITVAKTDGSATRPVAGTVLPFDVTTPAGYVGVVLNGIAGTGV
jgi:hypothetical protein